MAIYPGATPRLITPGSNDPAITPIGVILHVDAGDSKSLYDYFKDRSGGIESHFHIPKVGKPEQYRDTSKEADANFRGNSFLKDGKRYGFISVETQGLEPGEWNDHQLDEIKKLLLWASKTHNFPLRACPAWDEAGVGYHVMWGAPGPWTPVAKSCPGAKRIAQYKNTLIPWMKIVSAPPVLKPPATPVGDDVTPEQMKNIADQISLNTLWLHYRLLNDMEDVAIQEKAPESALLTAKVAAALEAYKKKLAEMRA